MVNTKKNKTALYIILALFIIIVAFLFAASFITSVGYDARRTALTAEAIAAYDDGAPVSQAFTVIIDAGHGGEDPGAVAGDLLEKDVNLAIAKKLKIFLELSGINVSLTRDRDILLYTEGQSSNKKMYDLKNRLSFAESFSEGIFVSIHMNKFSASQYFGPQTFYSENDERSLLLAESIQAATKLFSPDNTRTVKSENGTIYILENIKKPAVLVECGFLSNEREAYLLSKDEYRNAVAFSIFKGITDYLEANDGAKN